METDKNSDFTNGRADNNKEALIEDTDRRIEQLIENLSAQNAVIEKLKKDCKLSERIGNFKN